MNRVIEYLRAIDEERYEDSRRIAEQISDYEIYACLSAMNFEDKALLEDWKWLELMKLAKKDGIIAYILHTTHNNPNWGSFIEAGFAHAMRVGDFDFARDLLFVFVGPLNAPKVLSRLARAFEEAGGRWTDV